MAYIPKIISKEETLHGIARLHWIYVVKGIFWFFVMAGAGWILNALMSKAMLTMAASMDSAALPNAMLGITNVIMYFLMGGGFFIFLLFVMKVLFTEIGLSDRRVIHKTGMVFIKVQQVDLEEIRGENLDLGYFGRLLGYGYLMLDCRFIGDVKLPAIESPERFTRALHTLRAGTQDSLSVVVGKGNKKPLNIITPEDGDDGQPGGGDAVSMQQQPDIQPGQPAREPEVQPGNVPPRPEIPMQPTPHAPNPPANPPPQPQNPTPQPTQPIPAPPPTEPPLQPPSGTVQMDPVAVAQVVKAVLPQMAEEVVKKLEEQGMLNKPAPANDDVDNDLITVFDDARLESGGKSNDPDNKVEHVIH